MDLGRIWSSIGGGGDLRRFRRKMRRRERREARITAPAPTPTPIPILVAVGKPGSEEEAVGAEVEGDVVESGSAESDAELPFDGDAVFEAGEFVFVLLEELDEDSLLCAVLVVEVVEESVCDVVLAGEIVVEEPSNAALGVCPGK